MAMIKIDGVDLPSPSKFDLPEMDLDSSDSNRDELGYLHRDRIRQGVYKIELEWKGINNTQLNLIETAIKPVQIDVTFPTSEGMKTKVMYAGDRKRSMIKYNGETNITWDLSFNLTEY